MEFSPRAPREGINVSKTHPLEEAATLVGGLVAVVALLGLIAALGTDYAVGLISPETEAAMFESLPFTKEMAGGVAEPDQREQEVQAVLDRLASHWTGAPYEFRVIVLPEGEANAVALPGGHILVTSALIDEAESENELAFVLGHELGHFRNRDHLRHMGRIVVYRLALAAVLGSSGSVPDLANRVGDLTSLGFDRKQERDADHFGLELVQAEYGHVGSTWKFFERMKGNRQLGRFAAYFSNHPASESRIDDLRRYARQSGWALDGPTRAF